MIRASFQSQYGIRFTTDLPGMKWQEFADLLAGLSPETPLGRMVSIRSERNPDVIKNFTPDQKRIRAEWAKKSASHVTEEQMRTMLDSLKAAFIANAKTINTPREADNGNTDTVPPV